MKKVIIWLVKYLTAFYVHIKYMGHGIAGLQGPIYGGTGCFHSRKVIYGLSPDDIDSINGK